MSDADDDNDFEGDDVGPAQDLSSAEAADADPSAPDEDDGDTDDLDVPAKQWRRDRTPSAKARELFRAGAASLAKQLAAQEADEDDGAEDEDPDIGADDAPAEEAAPAAAEATTPAAAETAPAPQPDPQLEQLRADLAAARAEAERFNSRAAELDAREQALADLERAADEERRRETYLEKPADVIADLVKKYSGATSDEELADELSDLIVEMSARVNKMPLDEAIKDRLEMKRTKRFVLSQKDAIAKREAATTKQREAEAAKAEEARTAEAKKADIRRAHGFIAKEIAKPDNAKIYPFLALEDNAGEIVFELIEDRFKKDGTTLAWAEAAKQANDYLRNQVSAYYDKRKHLLDAQPGIGASGTTSTSASGDPTGIRRSRALTNAATATAPRTPAPPQAPTKWDPDAHRRATMRKLKVAVATQRK